MQRRGPTEAGNDSQALVGAGKGAAILLFPQVVLGAFLAFVPDNVLFVSTQIATLAHVVIGVLTLPIILLLGLRHARRLAPAPQSTAQRIVTGAFVATVLAACASGIAVSVAYGHAPATIHLVLGTALALPMALHLLLSRRRRLGIAAVSLFALSLGAVVWARSRKPQQPAEPLSPEFAYRLRPEAAYDDSRWCGECHQADYESWSRSMHARTLDVSEVLKSYVEDPGQRGHRLTEVQAILDGSLHLDGLPNNIRSLDACVSCHAPVAYYSDAAEPVEEHSRTGGVGCVFCHTLRGVRQGHRVSDAYVGLLRGKSDFDAKGVFASRVDYVSAPETVRRYLFQGSGNWLARRIGNALIRWRPSMHSHDYGAAFLREDGACRSCHSFAWTASTESINVLAPMGPPRTSGPRTNDKACWDCHMRDSRDPARGLSHLFLGGNAKAAVQLGDGVLASAEHEYGLEGPTLDVRGATLRDGVLDVAIDIRSPVPHAFPTTTGEARVAWLRVFALDARGVIVADTQGDGVVPESLVVPAYDRLEPYEARSLSTTLALPNGRPVTITAQLYHSFDKEPIAQATSSTN